MNNAIARIETDSSSLYKSQTRRSLWISEMQVTEEFSDKRKTLVVQSGVKVEHEFNTVSFTLCYPVYNDYTYKVRYRLEGYSDQWIPDGTNWTQFAEKVCPSSLWKLCFSGGDI